MPGDDAWWLSFLLRWGVPKDRCYLSFYGEGANSAQIENLYSTIKEAQENLAVFTDPCQGLPPGSVSGIIEVDRNSRSLRVIRLKVKGEPGSRVTSQTPGQPWLAGYEIYMEDHDNAFWDLPIDDRELFFDPAAEQRILIPLLREAMASSAPRLPSRRPANVRDSPSYKDGQSRPTGCLPVLALAVALTLMGLISAGWSYLESATSPTKGELQGRC